MPEMYLVQYCMGSYSDFRETNVFVTHSEEKAKSWVELATKQWEEALKIKCPDGDYDPEKYRVYSEEWKPLYEEWKKQRTHILTLTPELFVYDEFDDVGFSYFPIEVR